MFLDRMRKNKFILYDSSRYMILAVMTRKLVIALLLALSVDWIWAKSVAEITKKSIVDSECSKEGFWKMKVFLTVSSLAYTENHTIVERQLEMNWFGGKVFEGDVVAIYNTDPSQSVAIPLELVNASISEEGYYRTRVMFPRVTFTEDNLTSECLGYWIAYVSENEIVDTNCLRARPYWMNNLRKYIDGFTLREVMLPGAHDSASYSYFNPHEDTILIRYMYAQEERIFNQLAYGIRYFDIRAAHYVDLSPSYWINHGIFRTKTTLLEVLTDVVNFVKKTGELVILDFHKFPFGINTLEDHEKLIRYISDILQGHMIINRNVTTNMTIGDIMNGKQRILVAYNHPHAYNDHAFWPPLCQVWADKRDLTELKDYFASFYSRRSSPSYLWSSMAELTPNTVYIAFHMDGGLRKLADKTNRFVTKWYRDIWWKLPNIVATDYVLGNNIIDVAIETNKKRKVCGVIPGKKIKEGPSSLCSSS